MVLWQRYIGRLKVANRKARHDTAWGEARKVIETLKVEGQSGDETEHEDVFGHRVVRRLRRPWICQEISSLVAAIDSYSMEEKDQVGMRKQGNVGLTRHTTAVTDDDRPYMINLPLNFYDADWFRRLDEYEKAELNVQPALNIPVLVSYN